MSKYYECDAEILRLEAQLAKQRATRFSIQRDEALVSIRSLAEKALQSGETTLIRKILVEIIQVVDSCKDRKDVKNAPRKEEGAYSTAQQPYLTATGNKKNQKKALSEGPKAAEGPKAVVEATAETSAVDDDSGSNLPNEAGVSDSNGANKKRKKSSQQRRKEKANQFLQLLDNKDDEDSLKKLQDAIASSEPDALCKVLSQLPISALIALDTAVEAVDNAQRALHAALRSVVLEGEVKLDFNAMVVWVTRRCIALRRVVVSASVTHEHVFLLLNADAVMSGVAYLSLAGATGLKDTELSLLPTGLKHLDLSNCSGITEAGIVALAKQCSELQKLDLSDGPLTSSDSDPGAQTEALTQLGTRCLKLDRIQLGDPPLSAVRTLVKECKSLTTIYLKPTSSWEICSDETLECIGEYGGKLESLCIDTSVLHSLGDDDQSLITDAGLRALGEGCPKLSTLLLPFSSEITDDGLKLLGESCPGLAEGCGQIVSELVKAEEKEHEEGTEIGVARGSIRELKLSKKAAAVLAKDTEGPVKISFWK